MFPLTSFGPGISRGNAARLGGRPRRPPHPMRPGRNGAPSRARNRRLRLRSPPTLRESAPLHGADSEPGHGRRQPHPNAEPPLRSPVGNTATGAVTQVRNAGDQVRNAGDGQTSTRRRAGRSARTAATRSRSARGCSRLYNGIGRNGDPCYTGTDRTASNPVDPAGGRRTRSRIMKIKLTAKNVRTLPHRGGAFRYGDADCPTLYPNVTRSGTVFDSVRHGGEGLSSGASLAWRRPVTGETWNRRVTCAECGGPLERPKKVPVCFQCFLGWSNRTKPEPKPAANVPAGKRPDSGVGRRRADPGGAAHDIGIHNQTA